MPLNLRAARMRPLWSAAVFVTALLLGACEREPQPPAVVRIAPNTVTAEIIDSGVYRVSGVTTGYAAGGTAAGKVGIHEKEELISASTTLRAEKGATFGYRYRIVGNYDGPAEGLEMRAIHPVLRGPDGRLSTTSTAGKLVVFVRGKAEDAVLYTLDQDFEVVPGEWTLEILLNRQVLLSRTFTLTQ